MSMRRLACRPQFPIVTLAFGLHRTWFADEFANSSEGWTFGVPAGAVTAASLLRDHSSNYFDEGGAAEGAIAMEELGDARLDGRPGDGRLGDGRSGDGRFGDE